MEQIDQLLALMDRPAFCVRSGSITAVNHAARSLALAVGMELAPLLSTGREDYAEFTDGCLGLELCIHGVRRAAFVTSTEHGRLFTLEPEGTGEDLRMLALAAQALREPLADLMALTAGMDDAAPQRAALSRGLHRLLRIVGNMTPPPAFRPEMVEMNAILRELWDRAQPACDAQGVRLTLVPYPAPVYTCADASLLTRAIHNLLSNSMKFSGSREFRLELLRSGGVYRIRFLDPGAVLPADPFTRYLREPGLEDPRNGLGMGLHLVHHAAIAHGGSARMIPVRGGGVLTELRLPMLQDGQVRSPRLSVSYTGEWDPLLVELSDVLPPEFYL